MLDREKVILALELCRYDPDPGQEKKWYHSCLKCPYCTDRNEMEMNCAQMYTDAVTLLREQEPVEPTAKDEVIRVKYNCGECGYLVGFVSTIHNDMQYRAKYCPECGRKVLWHG